MLNRRSMIAGTTALLAAPAVLRLSALDRVPGALYELWEFRCPLLAPIIDVRDVNRHIEKYLSPRGNPYEGVWTFFGPKGRNGIYADNAVSFYKRELTALSG